jgi:hypothetical protein
MTEFSRSLVADVQATADAEGTTTPEAFTRRVFEDLEQAGVVTNTFTAYHKMHGHEVHGYGIGESGDSLDLFVTDFHLEPLETKLTKAPTDTAFRRLLVFVQRCRDGLRQHIDESFDVYDMCAAVEKALTEVRRIRLFLLSNRVCTATEVPASSFDRLPVAHEVWDLARLHRHATSGALGEPIMVPFVPPLPCVSAPSSEEGHSVVLAVVLRRVRHPAPRTQRSLLPPDPWCRQPGNPGNPAERAEQVPGLQQRDHRHRLAGRLRERP